MIYRHPNDRRPDKHTDRPTDQSNAVVEICRVETHTYTYAPTQAKTFRQSLLMHNCNNNKNNKRKKRNRTNSTYKKIQLNDFIENKKETKKTEINDYYLYFAMDCFFFAQK